MCQKTVGRIRAASALTDLDWQGVYRPCTVHTLHICHHSAAQQPRPAAASHRHRTMLSGTGGTVTTIQPCHSSDKNHHQAIFRSCSQIYLFTQTLLIAEDKQKRIITLWNVTFLRDAASQILYNIYNRIFHFYSVFLISPEFAEFITQRNYHKYISIH